MSNIKIGVYASSVGCKCQPLNPMNDTNEFTISADYEGRYYATCKHCGRVIKLFRENIPYFERPKNGECVYDKRYGNGKIDRYDHFMSSITVDFGDNKHHLYNFDGEDYVNNDGQRLFYEGE